MHVDRCRCRRRCRRTDDVVALYVSMNDSWRIYAESLSEKCWVNTPSLTDGPKEKQCSFFIMCVQPKRKWKIFWCDPMPCNAMRHDAFVFQTFGGYTADTYRETRPISNIVSLNRNYTTACHLAFMPSVVLKAWCYQCHAMAVAPAMRCRLAAHIERTAMCTMTVRRRCVFVCK